MALIPPWLDLDAAARQRLPALWERLVHEPSILSGVIEDTAQPAATRLQGWGVSMIMPPQVVADLALEQAPRSDAARRVYARFLDGSFPFLSDRDIGALNAGGELVLVVLHYCMRNMDVTQAYTHNVLASANDSFREFHEGYNPKAILYLNNALTEPIALASGFRLRQFVDAAEVAHLPPERRPAIFGLSREEARTQLPGTPVRHCFDSQPPLFRFSESQRRLLWLALFDDSDEALLPQLDVSVHGLKKLWRGIYERIVDVAPEFFGTDVNEEEGRRGPEKRRQVLAYVRQRPEELRPWADR